VDDISDIQAMYDSGWEKEDSRLQRHQLERDITWRYLEKYLPAPGSNLLEIGSATGRYTLELAKRGYKVLAIDLSPELVAGAKARAFETGLSERIEFRVGDARTLTGIAESAFDGALVMGPLYHLVVREDRLMVLNQVFKFLKPNGVIFTAWLSRFGITGDLIKKHAEIIEDREEIRLLLEQGRDPDTYQGGFRGYFARVDEIPVIHEETGFHTIVMAGAEPAISADDASYNILEGDRRRLWLDLLFRISSEPSMVACSRHLLYIGKKLTK
jgi:S-adenosylmethionine-dependent methyltransferase